MASTAACSWKASEDVGAERDDDTRSVCWRHRLLLMGTTSTVPSARWSDSRACTCVQLEVARISLSFGSFSGARFPGAVRLELCWMKGRCRRYSHSHGWIDGLRCSCRSQIFSKPCSVEKSSDDARPSNGRRASRLPFLYSIGPRHLRLTSHE